MDRNKLLGVGYSPSFHRGSIDGQRRCLYQADWVWKVAPGAERFQFLHRVRDALGGDLTHDLLDIGIWLSYLRKAGYPGQQKEPNYAQISHSEIMSEGYSLGA